MECDGDVPLDPKNLEKVQKGSRVLQTMMRFTTNQPPEPCLLELIEVNQTTNVLLGDSHNDQGATFHTSTFTNFEQLDFSYVICNEYGQISLMKLKIVRYNN